MMVDNRSFAIGGEEGDVNKMAFMEILCAGSSAPGGIYLAGLDRLVFMDASIEEQDVIQMNEVAYGALFTHEGLGEVLVKSILRAGKFSGPYGASLCARAKDGQLVVLPDGDKVVSTKVVLREVPDQELVDRELMLHRDEYITADHSGYHVFYDPAGPSGHMARPGRVGIAMTPKGTLSPASSPAASPK
jgi:hypothetical protein